MWPTKEERFANHWPTQEWHPSPEEHELIKRLRMVERKSHYEIGRIVHRARSTVQAYCLRHDIEPNKQEPWKPTMDQAEMVRRMRQIDERSYETISKRLHVPKSKIVDWCVANNVHPGGAPASFEAEHGEVAKRDITVSPPMVAGHPISWGAITKGTILEGRPFDPQIKWFGLPR